MVVLATYALNVYAHTWFEAKWDSRLDHGPLHLLHEVQRQSTYMTGDALTVVRKFTQINGFFAHEEQVLLYLICSDNLEEREIGVRHILRIRRDQALAAQEAAKIQPNPKRKRIPKNPKKKVRNYQPRNINWSATSVEQLISLSEAQTEPPLCSHLTNHEIEDLINHPLIIDKFESNSQFAERAVKATTEAARKTTGSDRQDALTINKSDARMKVKTLRHKKHFTDSM